MSKTLVVVESPAKAKTISKFLGRNYFVKASMGHVRDLPKSQIGVDVESNYAIKYITIRGKGDTIKDLKSAAAKADKILLATDPDREGEAIAWHLQNLLEVNPQEASRIEFNEITKDAIKRAVKNPRKIDIYRVEAQQARRVLDRLVGYNLSPLLWKKIRKGLSAGRVQSVAVKLICDREEEISSFEREEYWSIIASLLAEKNSLKAKLTYINGEKAEIKNEQEAKEVEKNIQGHDFVIDSIKKKSQKRSPAPPFITSTLQQEAYRKLNFTAKKTMMVAQQLYEGLDLGKELGTVGLISYIRTDSTRISEDAQKDAREYILQKYGQKFLPEIPKQYQKKGKAQDAHEAIRPTYVTLSPEEIKKQLTNDQYKLYRLIWSRFLASQMSPAILDITTVDIAVAKYTFRANGSVLVFNGFMEIYIESKEEDEEKLGILPVLSEKQKLFLDNLELKQHFTQPPARFSEASLVKTLEEKGIGRPSTYAPIIETVISRGYVARENKQFYPTELGLVVNELLEEYFNEIIDIEFTANLEDQLDQVEEGLTEWRKIIDKFFKPFQKKLDHAEEFIKEIEIEDEVTDEICEKCGRNLVIKFSRYGKFLACPGFPDCRNTKPLLEDIGVKCPICNGKIVVRRSKKGRKFYGCTNYPKCEFISWDKPLEKKCPECENVLLEKITKKEGKRIVCSNEKCQYIEVNAEK